MGISWTVRSFYNNRTYETSKIDMLEKRKQVGRKVRFEYNALAVLKSDNKFRFWFVFHFFLELTRKHYHSLWRGYGNSCAVIGIRFSRQRLYYFSENKNKKIRKHTILKFRGGSVVSENEMSQ